MCGIQKKKNNKSLLRPTKDKHTVIQYGKTIKKL